MRNLLIVVAVLALVGATFAENFASTSDGSVSYPTVKAPGTWINLTDGTVENGFIWQYGGVIAWPDFSGSFAVQFAASDASGFTYPVEAINMALTLSKVSDQGTDSSITLFIIDYTGSIPDETTIFYSQNIPVTTFGTIPTWPSFLRYVLPFAAPVALDGDFVVGFHPEWAGGYSKFFICQDTSAAPYYTRDWTFIATGIGYPAGWQRTGVVWGGSNNQYIEVELNDTVTTVESTSLGDIKNLFN